MYNLKAGESALAILLAVSIIIGYGPGGAIAPPPAAYAASITAQPGDSFNVSGAQADTVTINSKR